MKKPKTVYEGGEIIKIEGVVIGEVYPDGHNPTTWGYLVYGDDNGADFVDSKAQAIEDLCQDHQDWMADLEEQRKEIEKQLAKFSGTSRPKHLSGE